MPSIADAKLITRVEELETAIRTHRNQKADDRCIEDDDRLYEALHDGIKCDRRVGDQCAMLENCKRFIENRTEGGGWPTYQELANMLFKCGRHAPDCHSSGHSDKEYGTSIAPDESDCTCGWVKIRDQLFFPE